MGWWGLKTIFRQACLGRGIAAFDLTVVDLVIQCYGMSMPPCGKWQPFGSTTVHRVRSIRNYPNLGCKLSSVAPLPVEAENA
jgi:hypothetical protein